MKLKRYCVTTMDNWTATKDFWTFWGMRRYFFACPVTAALRMWQWQNDKWRAINF